MSPRKNKVDNYSSEIHVSDFKKLINFSSLFILWFIRRQPLRRFLLKQFFTPKSYKLSDSEKHYLNSGQRFEISVNEQKVICWKWGNGPVVIFSHGWNGRGIQFQQFFDKFVNNGFSVVTFDGPGHGESEGKTSSYFQMTDTVRALIKHFSPENIHGIVGHSFGASATINAISKEKLQLPAVLIAPAIKLKEMLQKTIQIHGVPSIIFKSLITDYEKKYGYHFHNDNPHNLLKTFKPNALILHDSEDQVTPFSISQETANLYESIQLIKTEGLGHIRILKDHQVIDKTMDYLNSYKTHVMNILENENKFNSNKIINQ
jgi:predicted alpha/beta-fold hydrolase